MAKHKPQIESTPVGNRTGEKRTGESTGTNRTNRLMGQPTDTGRHSDTNPDRQSK